MKPKWIIPFSLIIGIFIVCFSQPINTLKHLNVFASTNQNQAVQTLPVDTEEQKAIKPETSPGTDPASQESSKPLAPPPLTDAPEVPPKNLGDIEDSSVVDQDAGSVKIAYLTFDDGPSPATEELLNILQDYKVQATFFMLEPRINSFPNSVMRIAEGEHGLGLHGATHNRKLFYQSEQSALAEMNLAQSTLAKLTGITTPFIRTPYGSKPNMTDSFKEAIAAAGFILWDWNVDSKDWYYKDVRLVEHTIKQLKSLEKRKIDPVILLHDNKYTVKYLPQLLSYLIDNNYELQKLDLTLEPVLLK